LTAKKPKGKAKDLSEEDLEFKRKQKEMQAKEKAAREKLLKKK